MLALKLCAQIKVGRNTDKRTENIICFMCFLRILTSPSSLARRVSALGFLKTISPCAAICAEIRPYHYQEKQIHHFVLSVPRPKS
jgi:hypothetical protein